MQSAVCTASTLRFLSDQCVALRRILSLRNFARADHVNDVRVNLPKQHQPHFLFRQRPKKLIAVCGDGFGFIPVRKAQVQYVFDGLLAAVRALELAGAPGLVLNPCTSQLSRASSGASRICNPFVRRSFHEEDVLLFSIALRGARFSCDVFAAVGITVGSQRIAGPARESGCNRVVRDCEYNRDLATRIAVRERH